MSVVYSNNANSNIATSITAVATSVSLTAGTGANFPSPTGGDFFRLTFIDAATGLINEIVHATARTGDVLTIVRGQEGTTAKAWTAGDIAANLITADDLRGTQTSAMYADDTGAVNAYAITLTPAPSAYKDGMSIGFSTVNANTISNPTVNVNGLGAITITRAGGDALKAGDLPANTPIDLKYNSSVARFEIQTDIIIGRLIGYQVFTTSGAYAKGTNNPRYVIVEVVGGGGGGASSSNSWSGSAGGYGRAMFLSSALGASETVTIGAAGAGGIAGGGAGGNGGSSVFGTTPSTTGITATGGVGGTASVPGINAGGIAAVAGAVANTSIVIRGGNGSYASTAQLSGSGGATIYGIGGAGYSAATAAAPATGYGAGGGAMGIVGASNVGGTGAAGLVIIWEYA